jgi:hypothetical protein
MLHRNPLLRLSLRVACDDPATRLWQEIPPLAWSAASLAGASGVQCDGPQRRRGNSAFYGHREKLLRFAGNGNGVRRLIRAAHFRHRPAWPTEWQDNRLR